MKYLLSIISVFLLFKTAASKTLLFDTYGFYNYEKVYSLSGDRKYIVYSAKKSTVETIVSSKIQSCQSTPPQEEKSRIEQKRDRKNTSV